jgi:predicted ATPase
LITRIEIDGFKTFQNFKLDLSPLQVIVGINGAGKSNVFDALHLLTQLVDVDVRSAFQEMRGEATERFTLFPDKHAANTITLAVEMLVNPSIKDSWGVQKALKYTRMRYELHITRVNEQNMERLSVTGESLKAIVRGDDEWIKTHGLTVKNGWLPEVRGGHLPFISTDPPQERNGHKTTIRLHQDGHGGGRKPPVAGKRERTVLSSVLHTEFPHAFAAREEIRNWKFLQLNPEALRQPGPMLASPYLASDGKYLANALWRIQGEDKGLLSDISSDLAHLVPGLLEVEIENDRARNQYVLKAIMQDHTVFTSRVLSDGTLRMLALATLKNDPEHQGVICFEEPENGVHPSRLHNIARLLRQLATDFKKIEDQNRPLRQILVNTYSPTFISQPDIRDALLFAFTALLIDPQQQNGQGQRENHSQRVTRIEQVGEARKQVQQLKLQGFDAEKRESARDSVFTIDQVKAFLDSEDQKEAFEYFAKG